MSLSFRPARSMTLNLGGMVTKVAYFGGRDRGAGWKWGDEVVGDVLHHGLPVDGGERGGGGDVQLGGIVFEVVTVFQVWKSLWTAFF